MIVAEHLSKHYGKTKAVDDLSFTVLPGRVTGFLGPNGAGKTTTMRMILGLDNPDSGAATVAGRRYRDIPAPLTQVGALLDAKAVAGGRTARAHLDALAVSNGIPRKRVIEVLRLVGLDQVAGKRVGGFSLGMSQRLGVAAALLGNPGTLMFDEPVNGLDPEGIQWIRQLMRGLASEGRTVLVSSHLMSEMALTADHLVVIGRGRLIADASVEELVGSSARSVLVRSRDDAALAIRLTSAGAATEPAPGGGLVVTGMPSGRVGEVALAAGIPLEELTPRRASLEEAFMELTRDQSEFATAGASIGPPGGFAPGVVGGDGAGDARAVAGPGTPWPPERRS
ncbi:MAG: ATP-binding cassette domain-containing protein [Actinomycetota bacterium]|nr:ATP-binding cassette domain-containing protein [Actinomycetota bacterium]